jgi:hypothetical protein
MASVLQFGPNEIVVTDPDEITYLKELIQRIVSEGRTEWVPFLCELEDGTPQTFDLLVTPGVPISIVSDVPRELYSGDAVVTSGSSRLG